VGAAPMRHGPLVADDGTTAFSVWAPRAERVDLLVDGRSEPMTALRDGWWRATVTAGDGSRYGFRLDGGEVRPDPASRRQPDGVHGLSAVVDPRCFRWSPQERSWRAAPLAGAVFYELHVGTFTPEGTFDAAIPHLADLAALGVTHLEVMPVNAFNGHAGWGYDGVCWYATHEPYGGPTAFARFVDAAHRRGLAVVLDVVYNHLGPSGSYLAEFGPYLSTGHTTPWGEALNLDGPDSDAVRAFIIGNAVWWFRDLHVDGLRLDAVHGLVDTSAVHLLAELADTTAVAAAVLGRPLHLVAESDRSDPQTIRPRETGGLGLDAQWADDLHHAVHVALTGERESYYADYTGLVDVARAYREGFCYGGRRSGYRRRTVGAPLPDDVPGWRLVTCLQNHDQVGNRAAGERLTALVDAALVRVGVVLLCASPTTPLLFMGEEYGETRPFQYFTSHPEPDLAEAVRRGRREEFAAFSAFGGAADVPDPQDPATVAASTLDRAGAATAAGQARRALWQDLLALRRREPALASGARDLVEVVEASPDWLVLVRHAPAHVDGSAVAVTANLAPQRQERQCALALRDARLLLCSDDERYGGDGGAATMSSAGGTTTVALPAHSACLWALDLTDSDAEQM